MATTREWPSWPDCIRCEQPNKLAGVSPYCGTCFLQIEDAKNESIIMHYQYKLEATWKPQ